MRRAIVALALVLATDAAAAERPLASAEVERKLLESFEKAVASRDSQQIRPALHEMKTYRNTTFRQAACAVLYYRASPVDRKEVMEQARSEKIIGRDPILALIARREELLQLDAVEVLAGFPSREVGRPLHRLLKDKDLAKVKPRLTVAVLTAMGEVGYTAAWDEIRREFNRGRDRDVMQAAVRYFGATREKRAVKLLLHWIDKPRTYDLDRNSFSNETYLTWEYIHDDVIDALERITGQVFDTRREASDWIRKHGGRLGIR